MEGRARTVGQKEWSWTICDYLPNVVDVYDRWMEALATALGIDASRVGLFGFSAGADAVAELLARGCCALKYRGIGLGVVHGHGQDSADGLPKTRRDCVLAQSLPTPRGVVACFAAAGGGRL